MPGRSRHPWWFPDNPPPKARTNFRDDEQREMVIPQLELLDYHLLLYRQPFIRCPLEHRSVIHLCLLVTKNLMAGKPAQAGPMPGIAERDLLTVGRYPCHGVELLEFRLRPKGPTSVPGQPVLGQVDGAWNGSVAFGLP